MESSPTSAKAGIRAVGATDLSRRFSAGKVAINGSRVRLSGRHQTAHGFSRAASRIPFLLSSQAGFTRRGCNCASPKGGTVVARLVRAGRGWPCRNVCESRRAGRHLIKHLVFVKRGAGSIQKQEKFVLVTLSPMMLLLILNVMPHRIDVRRAHRKGSISFLPSWPRPALAQPSRRVGFQLLHRLRRRNNCGNASQHVNVVSCSADGECVVVQVIGNAGDVGPQFRRLGDRKDAAFGREDDVKNDGGVGVCHCVVPLRGTREHSYMPRFPALTSRATIVAPFGLAEEAARFQPGRTAKRISKRSAITGQLLAGDYWLLASGSVAPARRAEQP